MLSSCFLFVVYSRIYMVRFYVMLLLYFHNNSRLNKPTNSRDTPAQTSIIARVFNQQKLRHDCTNANYLELTSKSSDASTCFLLHYALGNESLDHTFQKCFDHLSSRDLNEHTCRVITWYIVVVAQIF